MTQFPCRKRIRNRTIYTEAADGTVVKLFDPGAGVLRWQLTLRHLNAGEWDAVERLFCNAHGRAGTFVFLDPFGNLLAWSESLYAAAWQHSGGVSVASAPDAFGDYRGSRVTNTDAGRGWIEQAVLIPGSYRSCLSVYARSDAAAEVALYARAGEQTVNRAYTVASQWRRLELSCTFQQASESVTFGALLPANGTVDLFGFQVDPQAGASVYKVSGEQSAVYTAASFTEDVLEMTSEGPGAYSCTVGIQARAD